MVEAKNKTSAARARIAHKLAKYVRANPINLTGISGPNQPSASHLSICLSKQPSEEPPKEDSETARKLGTPPMMRKFTTKELPKNLNPTKAGNPSSPAPSSFYSPVSTEEEESSS